MFLIIREVDVVFVPSGLYFCERLTGGTELIHKLLVLRTAGIGSSRECLMGVRPVTLSVFGDDIEREVHGVGRDSSVVLLGVVALELEAYS